MSGTDDDDNGDGSRAGKHSAEELQAHIEQTRHELADTVEALGAKLDVKTRARDQVTVSKDRAVAQVEAARARVTDAATDDQGQVRPVVPIAAGAVVLLLVGVVVVRRRAR